MLIMRIMLLSPYLIINPTKNVLALAPFCRACAKKETEGEKKILHLALQTLS